jgi:hypothetical protein
MQPVIIEEGAPGVYGLDAGGLPVLIHLYQGGHYGITDIVELFDLGKLVAGRYLEEPVLLLSQRELRELKMLADAHSFDCEQGFIEMCYEIQRFGQSQPSDEVIVAANFSGTDE